MDHDIQQLMSALPSALSTKFAESPFEAHCGMSRANC